MSRWQDTPVAPADPILGLTQAFNKDTHPNKLNLGVGAYRTEEEEAIFTEGVNHEYTPIDGAPAYKQAAANLIFGADHPVITENRTISGTGALRIAAEWMKREMPNGTVYFSDPTWGNHPKIFAAAGLKTSTYRYFDRSTKAVNFEQMKADIEALPSESAVVLHACAHNPTGADPSLEHWQELLAVCQKTKPLIIFDSAYQGFATGDLARDAAALRLFGASGLEFIICQSFAKNLGLYGERAGAVHFVASSADVAAAVLSQVKMIIRPMYSSPPIHGSLIASRVINDPALFAMWQEHLHTMSSRIAEMRRLLFERLKEIGCPGDWSHIVKQIGMFTFTEAQVAILTEKHHIYLTKDGRISMAGLSAATVPYLADAIFDAVKTTQSQL